MKILLARLTFNVTNGIVLSSNDTCKDFLAGYAFHSEAKNLHKDELASANKADSA